MKLRLKNLDKWQHYKRRNPPWIKLYNSIFNDYQFSSMSESQRLHLLMLWSLASVMDNELPHDANWLAARINADSDIDIQAFIELGYMEEVDETK